MNERINGLWWKARIGYNNQNCDPEVLEKFAELIVRECLDKIETYRIPVGNSAASEMACEWTHDALMEIRDEIKEHFGVEE
jgi:hypothetical protein